MHVRVSFYAKPEPGGKRQRRIARVERDAPDIAQALGFVYAVLQRTQDRTLLSSVASVKIEVMDETNPAAVEFAT